MKYKRSLIEHIKTVVIAMLLASAVFLLHESGVVYQFTQSLDMLVANIGAAGDSQSGQSLLNSGSEYARASEPLCMAVCSGSGQRYGLKYSAAELTKLYGDTAPVLKAVLSASGSLKACDKQEWETALSGSGIYMDFRCDRSMEVTAMWLGTGINSRLEGESAKRIMLLCENKSVSLYYTGSSGEMAKYATNVSSAQLEEIIAGYTPTESLFAFEAGEEYGLIDPYTLLAGRLPAIKAVSAENPFLSSLSNAQILSAFEMNELTSSHYPESSGTTVYVDGGLSLRVYSSGAVIFKQTGTNAMRVGNVENGADEEQAVSAAYELVQKTAGAWAGDGGLMFAGCTWDESSDSWIVCFDYAVNGMPVVSAAYEHACTIDISAGCITRAEIFMRRYTTGDGTLSPLPERQAAAVVSALGDGEPVLVYMDTRDVKTEMTSGWIRA